MRLHKFLAHAGVGSRRKCEQYILQGRVRVNQKTVELGYIVDPQTDVVTFDNRTISAEPDRIYVMLHKPAGVVSSLAPRRKEKGLLDLVSVNERVYPVGRLDKLSEGLILLTNDGDTTYRLTHPSFRHEREYRVQLKGMLSSQDLQAWREGVWLEPGVKTAPAKVWILSSTGSTSWLGVILHEGRKRQIRRVVEGFGYPVQRLIRVRIGPIELGDLPQGSWRHLSVSEIAKLQKFLEQQPVNRAASSSGAA